MVHSMTAYANQSIQLPNGMARWELRSVNHRFLELSFKLPEFLNDVEPDLRAIAEATLSRGKVECGLRLELSEEKNNAFVINLDVLDQLMVANQEIISRFPTTSLSVLDILRWPSILQPVQKDWVALKEPLKQSFILALQDLSDTRAREGAKLKKCIQVRLASIRCRLQKTHQRLPLILQEFRTKLLEKLSSLNIEIDPSRFEAVLVSLLQKMDITEELDRLNAHLEEIDRILITEKVMGRRLDFLMQELNREANTLGSKANDKFLSEDAIELKVLIEEMREQIQNIE